jgi:hypothetical protein
MSSGKTIAALAFLLALMTGCGLRPHRTPLPAAAQAPSVAPTQMALLIPPVPPLLPVVWERPIKLDTTVPPEPKPQTQVPPARRPPHRHARTTAAQETAQTESKTATPPANTETAAQNPPAAAGGQPSETSPIGQLSTANDTSNTADRSEIVKQIDDTENTLNGIKRSLSAEEQKTVIQIRTYITRAREALKNDDLDGARTTSTKAHVLILELTQ